MKISTFSMLNSKQDIRFGVLFFTLYESRNNRNCIFLQSEAGMRVNVKPSAFLSDEFYGTLEKMQKTN